MENNLKSADCGHDHAHDHSPVPEFDCACCSDHDHGAPASESKTAMRITRALQVVGIIIFVAVLILKLPGIWELAAFLTAYFLIGWEVLLRAVKNILRGEIFDENFLMSIATVGAFAIGEYPEGVAVMLFYQVGEAFQDKAVDKSRGSIAALMDIRPEFANLIMGDTGDNVTKVNPEQVAVGDRILIRPGERVPLDGTVVKGNSAIDASALTGESLPKDVLPGSEVLSGAINMNGLLTVEVTKTYGESTVAKILEMVENASVNKAPIENFISRFARYYTPIVVFSAVALAVIPPLITGGSFADWVNRALVFLVVSCPCALVISIPLSFFSGIGSASANGVLVKGGNYLDALNQIDTIVFDKTGTLTKGVFSVADIVPAEGVTAENLLHHAALAEHHSNHPIAVSIATAYGKPVDESEITEYEEIPGYGIRAKANGDNVLAGNAKFLEREGISFAPASAVGTVVYVAAGGGYAGHLVIADEVKSDSASAIEELKKLGIRRTIMLTGDNSHSAEAIAIQVGIDEVFSEMLPLQKVEKVEQLEGELEGKGKLVFVGDGINDAPVLGRSDIGVAMGGIGSDAAIEAADVVLMTDEPFKIVTAIRIAKKTHRIVWQNIIFALGIKGIILVLGALGFANMWEAVFGDVGVALIAILNSLRIR